MNKTPGKNKSNIKFPSITLDEVDQNRKYERTKPDLKIKNFNEKILYLRTSDYFDTYDRHETFNFETSSNEVNEVEREESIIIPSSASKPQGQESYFSNKSY